MFNRREFQVKRNKEPEERKQYNNPLCDLTSTQPVKKEKKKSSSTELKSNPK
jgi:hypothetical protein